MAKLGEGDMRWIVEVRIQKSEREKEKANNEG